MKIRGIWLKVDYVLEFEVLFPFLWKVISDFMPFITTFDISYSTFNAK